MVSPEVRVSPQALVNVPYDQKWDVLKPAIERLYVQENWKLQDIMAALRDQCNFTAVETQYKYQIKKWQLKKSISTAKKAAVCKVVQKRAELGKSSAITRNGQQFESKNMRRYLKKEARKEMTLRSVVDGPPEASGVLSTRAAQFGRRMFMNWNMPYGTTRSVDARAASHTSPLSDIMVTTPPSPHDASSPMTVAIKSMTKLDRTRLLVEGRHNELIRSMERKQAAITSTWLYHFWYFSFKTAKHWGRGPQVWTANLLGINGYRPGRSSSLSLVTTPATNHDSPASQDTPKSYQAANFRECATCPTQLCRWGIHCQPPSYQRIPSPPPQRQMDIDLDDEQSWPAWPASSESIHYADTLVTGLDNNNFTTITQEDLPVVADQVSRAAGKSPEEIHEEALGFSIIGRNVDLMEILFETSVDFGYKTQGIYPYHLAVTYLDGSRTCCNLLDGLTEILPLTQHYINDLGHTVLDQLMITVLRSHTSCSPSVVDNIFKADKRFEGEDVDICGRWDADSPCIRERLEKGSLRVPFSWKHMFCHTSVQTICHCIGTLFGPLYGPDINTPSGLFVRRCLHCGMKMQLLPLHTLIVVGFHLSTSGCHDETLFGILTCLLCLLSNGANPRLKANICVRALFDNEDVKVCDHKEIDVTSLVDSLVAKNTSNWSAEVRTTWKIINAILKISRATRRDGTQVGDEAAEHDDNFDSFITFSEDESDSDSESASSPLPPTHRICELCGLRLCFDDNTCLATLWAAVQTELLSYRRLKEGDGWLSRYFDLNALLSGLDARKAVTIPLVENDMINEICECGNFSKQRVPACPFVDEACAYYFSNMEDWGRSTFIYAPEDRWDRWCC